MKTFMILYLSSYTHQFILEALDEKYLGLVMVMIPLLAEEGAVLCMFMVTLFAKYLAAIEIKILVPLPLYYIYEPENGVSVERGTGGSSLHFSRVLKQRLVLVQTMTRVSVCKKK